MKPETGNRKPATRKFHLREYRELYPFKKQAELVEDSMPEEFEFDAWHKTLSANVGNLATVVSGLRAIMPDIDSLLPRDARQLTDAQMRLFQQILRQMQTVDRDVRVLRRRRDREKGSVFGGIPGFERPAVDPIEAERRRRRNEEKRRLNDFLSFDPSKAGCGLPSAECTGNVFASNNEALKRDFDALRMAGVSFDVERKQLSFSAGDTCHFELTFSPHSVGRQNECRAVPKCVVRIDEEKYPKGALKVAFIERGKCRAAERAAKKRFGQSEVREMNENSASQKCTTLHAVHSFYSGEVRRLIAAFGSA